MATTRLIILNGAHKGEELELQRGCNRLGRAQANDFVFDDLALSGRHCEILVSEFSVRVRDLGSTNGTWVDNQRVQEAEARNGQILTFGSLKMRLVMPPVEITIPPLPQAAEPVPMALEDGRPACLNHPGVAATHRCSQCGHTYCEACVSELHLVGGRSRLFCPACSGACLSLADQATAKKASFASRFLETIRIPFRRSRPKSKKP